MTTIPQIHPGKDDRPVRRLLTGHHGVRPKHNLARLHTAKSRPRDVKIPAQLCRSAARTRRNQLAPLRPNRVRPQPITISP